MSVRGSTLVGLLVSILIIGAVASIGYYQVIVAPGLSTATSSSSSSQVNCSTSHTCVNVTIVSGAQSQYAGYKTGSTTLYGYSPLTITVVVGVNNTVVWRNNDTAIHTATSSTSAPGPFNSRCLDGLGVSCSPGQGSGSSTYQFTFTVAGTYTYNCLYHPWMQGTIIVKSA
jgi:plastocyanin